MHTNAGDDAEHDGAHRSGEARRRRDRDQAGHGTGGAAEQARLTLGHLLGQHPRQRRCRGGHEGVDHGQRGRAVGLERRAGVEAEPADPQQRGADQGHGQRVRRHGFAAEADALADDEGAHQAGDAGIDVHDRAAGEVERAPLEGQAGVGRDGVQGRLRCGLGVIARRGGERLGGGHQSHPGRPSTRPCARSGSRRSVAHSGMNSTMAENFMRSAIEPTISAQRDGRERHLEADVHVFRDHHAVGERLGVRVRRDAGEERLGEAADEGVEGAAFREGQAVAVDHPQDDDDALDEEHLHQHRQHVLGAHEAAVEERQARDRHQQDECRGRHHPGGIALVGRRRGRRRRLRQRGSGDERHEGRRDCESGNPAQGTRLHV